MSRVLLILAVAAVVYAMLKSRRTALSGQHAAPPADRVRPAAEDMVRCAQCGVHLPKSESIVARGQYYCCEAHGRTDQAPPADHNAG